MSDLQKRLDQYINRDHSDPLAIGLIMELRAHLKSANSASERISKGAYKRMVEGFHTDDRIRKIEAHLGMNEEPKS